MEEHSCCRELWIPPRLLSVWVSVFRSVSFLYPKLADISSCQGPSCRHCGYHLPEPWAAFLCPPRQFGVLSSVFFCAFIPSLGKIKDCTYCILQSDDFMCTHTHTHIYIVKGMHVKLITHPSFYELTFSLLLLFGRNA